MADEAVIIELLGMNNAGDVIQYNVANATAIAKGALLQLTDNRTALASAADKPCAGIAASEKVASDGQLTLGLYTNGIFDLKDSGAGGAVGLSIVLGGVNTVKSAATSEDGRIFGKRFATSGFLLSVQNALSPGAYTYNVLYMLLIFLFAYFWTTVQFQPKELAKNLRDSGSFIRGLRPGRRTAEYLETVMTRITYFGAIFLAIIAVVPTVISILLGVDWRVATFLGGTGLLIVVSVSLDLVQKIEANLLMRSYEGFSETGRIKGAYG